MNHNIKKTISIFIFSIIFFSEASRSEFNITQYSDTSTGTGNVIFVNGIMNKFDGFFDSVNAIENIISNSSIRKSSSDLSREKFRIKPIYNPFGVNDWNNLDIDNESNLVGFIGDFVELVKLKKDEEQYADDLLNIRAPHYLENYSTINTTSANNIVYFLDAMKDDPLLKPTYDAVVRIINAVELLDTAILIAHSEGNILANLAYAHLASRYGNELDSKLRVINIANTSKIAINSLDFTHSGDRALALLRASGLKVPRESNFCPSSLINEASNIYCIFQTADSSFSDSYIETDNAKHSLVETYLSKNEAPLPILNNIQKIDFESGNKFEDRFLDYFKTAFNSIKRPLGFSISSNQTIDTDASYSQINFYLQDYNSSSDFSYQIIRDGKVQVDKKLDVYEGSTDQTIITNKCHDFESGLKVCRPMTDNRTDNLISVSFTIINWIEENQTPETMSEYNYQDIYRFCKGNVCSDDMKFDFISKPCLENCF